LQFLQQKQIVCVFLPFRFAYNHFIINNYDAVNHLKALKTVIQKRKTGIMFLQIKMIFCCNKLRDYY
jgi:hypothetical protein